MDHNIKQSIRNQSTWKRGLYMLLYFVISRIAEVILFAVVVLQFIFKLINDETNDQLRHLGRGISHYLYEIFLYLNFSSDYQPYPLGSWPSGKTESRNEGAAEPDEEEIIAREIQQKPGID